MKPKILVITQINHIEGVLKNLKKVGKVINAGDVKINKIKKNLKDCSAIYTNPNKSKIYIGKNLIEEAKKLKVIATASTGTNHIDLDYAKRKKIKIKSLKKEKKIINKISSTAELSFALTLSLIRNINPSYKDVMNGNWDYEKFIGRQLNFLTVGIIGYGRLGKYYAKYCRAFGSKILIYDPYIKKSEKNHEFKNLDYLLKNSDILALHIHADKKNYKFMNKKKLSKLKKNVAIINTSRGEVIDESSLVDFLKKNKKAKVATDVLFDEIRNRLKSRLLNYAKKNQNQVLITPHIGGMTTEGQNIAYNAVVKKLERFFNG